MDPVHHSSFEVNLLVMGSSSTDTNNRHTDPTQQGKGWVANSNTGVLVSPKPDLLPDVFCLMVRIFRLMLVLLYI